MSHAPHRADQIDEDALDERAYEHVVDFVAAAALKDLDRGREFALGMAKALARMPARPSSRTPTPMPINDGAVDAASRKEESCPVEVDQKSSTSVASSDAPDGLTAPSRARAAVRSIIASTATKTPD